MHRHERPPLPRTRPPGTELLPVLVWLNRRELASRFPAWQPLPGLHAEDGEHERASGPTHAAEPEPPR